MAAQPREWRPANEVEAQLLRASNDGDQRTYFQILTRAPLYLPASAESQRQGSPRLFSWDAEGVRIVPAYTSLEALADGAGEVADGYAVTTYPELAANWPDPTWKLAVDPQLSIGVYADIGDIDRGARGELAVPSAPELMEAALADLVPANAVEARLRTARLAGDVPAYLEAMLGDEVLVPVARAVADPEEIAQPDFPWRPMPGPDGVIAVFTSPERLAEGWPDAEPVVPVPFMSVAQYWPGGAHPMAVNAGTPLELVLSAESVRELVDRIYAELTGQPGGPADQAPPLVMLQKVLAPEEVEAYLGGGRQLVTGFVYPADRLSHLTTPAALYAALGLLLHPDSPFQPEDAEVHVLRWLAHCPALYRLALGGPDEATRQANRGWMVEPAPFRGTGVAAGGLPVPQLKVDSVMLPHGAVLVALNRTGREATVAIFDADFGTWLPAVPTEPSRDDGPAVTPVNGYRARWRGHEYEASPDGEAAVRLYTDTATPGFEEVRPGRHRRVAPRTDLDWFGYARTVAAWRDLPVLVLAERDGELLVEYLGGLGPAAAAAGLTRVEPGVYQGWVGSIDVDQIQQVRTP